MRPQLYSVNKLSDLTGADRKTLNKLIHANGIKPTDGKYALADIRACLDGKADKSLKDQKLAEEIRKLQIKNDKDQGKLIERARVAAGIMSVGPRMLSVLEQKLMNEQPGFVDPGLQGILRSHNRRVINETFSEWSSFASSLEMEPAEILAWLRERHGGLFTT